MQSSDPAAVLASLHQITRCFLGGAGDCHCGDLPQMQEPRQMRGIVGVGLDPVPGRADQLRRSGYLTADDQRRSRCGPTRTRSDPPHRSPPPGQADHRATPRSPHDRESTVVGTPHRCPHPKHTQHRTCVHIQTNTRTLNVHWGLPHLWLYRPGPTSCRQPRSHVSEAPAPIPSSARYGSRRNDVEPERERVQQTHELVERIAITVDGELVGRDRIVDGDVTELTIRET